MEFKGTKGPWKISRSGPMIVSDNKHSNKSNNTKDSVQFYGGYLIAESVLDKYDAKLIAAAPDLLIALQQAQGMLNHIRCINSSCDGKGAIQISEDEWEPCQWCDEKQYISKAINKALN